VPDLIGSHEGVVDICSIALPDQGGNIHVGIRRQEERLAGCRFAQASQPS